jgi:hypothetical protein
MSTETDTTSLVPSKLSPYAKFKMALKSKEVQRQYSSLLGKFLDFCKFEGLDIEQKAIKFCDFVKLKSQEEVEDLIIDLFYSKRKPQKDGTDKPLYDYQRMIFDVLVTQNGNANASNKHLWIKKATGQMFQSLCSALWPGFA